MSDIYDSPKTKTIKPYKENQKRFQSRKSKEELIGKQLIFDTTNMKENNNIINNNNDLKGKNYTQPLYINNNISLKKKECKPEFGILNDFLIELENDDSYKKEKDDNKIQNSNNKDRRINYLYMPKTQ